MPPSPKTTAGMPHTVCPRNHAESWTGHEALGAELVLPLLAVLHALVAIPPVVGPAEPYVTPTDASTQADVEVLDVPPSQKQGSDHKEDSIKTHKVVA